MKTYIALISAGFLFSSTISYGQKSSKYAGTYSFNWDSKTLPAGLLEVYPESDTTLLFYIENDKGAPNHANGVGYGRIIEKGDSAIFYLKDTKNFMNCRLYFKFLDGKVIVKTIDGYKDCGYGNGVYSDGTYFRKSGKIPKYFIFNGDTIDFSKKTLKKWYQDK